MKLQTETDTKVYNSWRRFNFSVHDQDIPGVELKRQETLYVWNFTLIPLYIVFLTDFHLVGLTVMLLVLSFQAYDQNLCIHEL